jgi:zinc transport system substrate-binding protein
MVAATGGGPPPPDPTTYRLTAAQVAVVHRAAVVVEIGGGFQPSFEAAALGAGAGAVVDLRAALGATDPYVWLDPVVMGRALTVIAAALERANPPAASLYRNGAEGFGAEVASTGIDYESTLSACPRSTIVTPDGAFQAVASEYGLTDQIVGTAPIPEAAALAAAVERVSTAGLTTVFSEPFADNGTINALAIAAHLKVRVLDPLTGSPPEGWASQANYLTLMEANLGTLNNALGCPNTDTGQ